jgi:cell division protein FtsW
VSSTSAPARARSAGADAGTTTHRGWWGRFESPVTTYYLLVGVTAALVVFGLIMVLSASAIVSIQETKGASAYSIFISQAVFATIGAVALTVASRLPMRSWKALAFPILFVGVALQVLVLFTGTAVNGNQNWLKVGPITVQPSEIIKLGLVLTGAVVLSKKRQHLHSFAHVVVPYLVPIVAVGVGAVALGHDLGTVLILGAIVAGVLFAAGVPLRWFAFAGVPFIGGVLWFVLSSANRLSRFDVWLGRDTDEFGTARQPIHGRYALADGGWLGVGLGQSREKWGLLSEPHNDFIFAIIGEELGLPGSLGVLALFAALALACYRLVTRTDDFFVRVATAGIMTWIIIQAVINIGAVINLLPVIGVPLPLVSSGGSALITTMFALGILLSFARPSPAAPRRCRPGLRRSAGPLPFFPAWAAGAGPARERHRASVLLAGGGTAGHVSPLLALADCLRRRDPDIAITALGTAAGLEARLVPERGYPMLEVPKVPLPRRPQVTCCGCPATCVAPFEPPRTPSRAPRPRSSSASAATSRRRPTSRRDGTASPSSSTSRTPARASRTASAPGSHPRWA